MFLYEVPEGMYMVWLRAVEGFVSVQKGSMKAITKQLFVAKPVQRRLIFPQDEIQVVLSVDGVVNVGLGWDHQLWNIKH